MNKPSTAVAFRGVDEHHLGLKSDGQVAQHPQADGVCKEGSGAAKKNGALHLMDLPT